MHPQVNDFIERVKRMYPTKFIGGKVLDVGSLDINGNNRHHFYCSEYTGIDVGEGPNVDLVVPGNQEFPFDSNIFDVVISTECMEHNEHYMTTIGQMYRVLKPGGVMIMTMAGHKRPEHGTKRSDPVASPHTQEYYKNIYLQDLSHILWWEEGFFPFCFEYGGAYDLYFYGIKTHG